MYQASGSTYSEHRHRHAQKKKKKSVGTVLRNRKASNYPYPEFGH